MLKGSALSDRVNCEVLDICMVVGSQGGGWLASPVKPHSALTSMISHAAHTPPAGIIMPIPPGPAK